VGLDDVGSKSSGNATFSSGTNSVVVWYLIGRSGDASLDEEMDVSALMFDKVGDGVLLIETRLQSIKMSTIWSD
jgi:hypothetical protein